MKIFRSMCKSFVGNTSDRAVVVQFGFGQGKRMPPQKAGGLSSNRTTSEQAHQLTLLTNRERREKSLLAAQASKPVS
jgi:hypothetical protein